nr:hypothetical protein [Eubacterium sp.]
MKTFLIVMGIVLAVLLIVFIVLSIVGKKLQGKQEESKRQMDAAAQVASILVIDKKRMRLKDAGLPKVIVENTPKYLRRSKVPIVKAKIGPKIMSLMCDEKIFPLLPVKKELKVVLSGIYIMDVKGSRNNLLSPEEKLGFFEKIRLKALKNIEK